MQELQDLDYKIHACTNETDLKFLELEVKVLLILLKG